MTPAETDPTTFGLSSEMGWGDAADEPSTWNGLASALLLGSTAVCYGLSWMVAGLPPLPRLATRLGTPETTPSRFRSVFSMRRSSPQ